MSNGAGSFLQGLAGGIGMGMQAKNFQKQNAMKDTSQQQAPVGTQAVQATAQNAADSTSGVAATPQAGMGLAPMQPAATAQPAAGTQNAIQAGASSMWQNILGMIGGGGK